MLNHVLAPDTQAILLLCASFGQNRQIEPLPLTLGEYNLLTDWLRENHKRPADLLEITAKAELQKITNNKLNPDRLVGLLHGQVAVYGYWDAVMLNIPSVLSKY